jgi:hypothetical protein
MLSEFLTSLTPHERDFCRDYLHISTDNDKTVLVNCYSSANIWQLTRRIYKKLQIYLGSTS